MPDLSATQHPLGPWCIYCGAPATVLDHVWARCDGGPNHAANLVDACASCNSSKGRLPLAEWLARTVLVRSPDERQRRIIERLRTGQIADRLGPPQKWWIVNFFDEDDESDWQPPSTLAECVIELAFQEVDGMIWRARNVSVRLDRTFGEEWTPFRNHLTEMWLR